MNLGSALDTHERLMDVEDFLFLSSTGECRKFFLPSVDDQPSDQVDECVELKPCRAASAAYLRIVSRVQVADIIRI